MIVNLAVNARNAMPVGGMLTIETATLFIDDDFPYLQQQIAPGDYILPL